MTVAELSERLRGLPGTMKIRFQVAQLGQKADCGFVTNATSFNGETLIIDGVIDNPGSMR